MFQCCGGCDAQQTSGPLADDRESDSCPPADNESSSDMSPEVSALSVCYLLLQVFVMAESRFHAALSLSEMLFFMFYLVILSHIFSTYCLTRLSLQSRSGYVQLNYILTLSVRNLLGKLHW